MKQILIAEDDKFLVTALADKLERDGFVVRRAKDGLEAMLLLKESKPDLVLLDLIMPKKNGFEVLAEMKADPQLKDVPVLVLSNLGQETDVAKAKSLGAQDYLVKADVQLAEVVVKVKKLLGS